ncbi:hypothetical protein JCM14719A_06500 [Calditerricola satsumensis]|uniref:Uncharacterized protein n=1 Tax=Calditerricola satsumensis TaxID=373054 RepID=A0A8J3B8U9_9BACI|nr:hypothetical protein GCM10007043_17450 [Calditerricola satsumensis]
MRPLVPLDPTCAVAVCREHTNNIRILQPASVVNAKRLPCLALDQLEKPPRRRLVAKQRVQKAPLG